jgi:hypothetical protein
MEARVATRGRVLLVALAGFLQTCGGDNLLLPSAGQPSKITIESGDGQNGTVGQELENPVVVVVTDPEDRPVQGVEVVFVAPAGAELAPNDTVLTGADGRAAVRYRLSTVAGEQVVEARAKPVVPSASLTATFTAMAAPGSAVSLVVAGGDGQVGVVSTALPESLAVRAIDGYGNGVPGVEVGWEATGGSLSPTTVVTGADGGAAVERIMGDVPGSYETTASASGLEGSPLSFTSNAMAAPSPALVLMVYPPSKAQAGVPFDPQPELQLQDPSGAPLSQADVTVTVAISTGPGSLGGHTTAVSDANGRVRFSDLSIRGVTGRRVLIFAADGFSPASSSSVVVSPGPADPGESTASVPDGRSAESTPITIRLNDEFGNRVEGQAGSLAVSVTGANEVSNIDVSDRGDGNYSASYKPIQAGTDQVHVRVGGDELSGSPFSSAVAAGPASPATTTATLSRTGFFFVQVIIVVITRDAQGNLLARGGDRVDVQLNGEAIGSLQDNQDGTYSGSFGTFASDLSVGVFLNGEPIAGSPFRP